LRDPRDWSTAANLPAQSGSDSIWNARRHLLAAATELTRATVSRSYAIAKFVLHEQNATWKPMSMRSSSIERFIHAHA
jgi:hypothetical protein